MYLEGKLQYDSYRRCIFMEKVQIIVEKPYLKKRKQ